MSERSLPFNPERMREAMWGEVQQLAQGLLEKSFKRLDEALDATETRYFSHKGRVLAKRTLVNWGARQDAITKVLQIADAIPQHNARDEDKKPSEAVLEIGPDGVYRLSIGGSSKNAPTAPLESEVRDDVKQLPTGVTHGMAPLASPRETEPEVVKVRTRADMKASFVEPDAQDDGCIQ